MFADRATDHTSVPARAAMDMLASVERNMFRHGGPDGGDGGNGGDVIFEVDEGHEYPG